MTELSEKQQSNLALVRGGFILAGIKPAPELAAFMEKSMHRAAGNPALEAIGDSFAAEIRKNPKQMNGINAALKADPDLAGRLQAAMEKDPQSFERSIPQIVAQPQNLSQIVATLEKSSPAVAAKKPESQPATAPVAGVLGATAQANNAAPKPAQPPAAPPAADQGLAQRAINAAIPSAQAAGTTRPPAAQTTNDDLDTIINAKGFREFEANLQSNKVPAVTEAARALIGNGNADPEASAAGMKAIADQLRKDPDFLIKINKTMDEKPGVLSGIANDITAFGGGAKGVLAGVAGYSQFSQSAFAQSSFGQMIFQFLEKLFTGGGLSGLVNGILGKAGMDFRVGTESQNIHVLSNNGGMGARQALAVVGSTPADVTVQDQNGNKVGETGQKFVAVAPKTPDPADPQRGQSGVVPQIP